MQLSKNIFILLFIASFLILCKKEQNSEVGSLPCTIPDVEKMLIDNSNKLGFDCFRQLSYLSATDENLLISPIGISLSLNALLQASQNRTNSEIKNCLNLNSLSDSIIISSYNHLNTLYSEIDINSKVLNSIKFAFGENFKLKSESDNFYASSKCTKIIYDENAGFIENIADKYYAQSLGNFQLINSFDFNASSKFQVRVEESPFYKSPNESNFVEMIVSKSQFNYFADQTVQVVELPLGRGNFNIMLIIPQNYESIDNFCKKLDYKIFEKIKKKFKPQLLEVIMPKIELTGIKTIKEVFNNSRIPSAFRPQIADFSKLSKDNNIYMIDFEHIVNLKIISSVDQNVDLAVDTFEKTTSGSILIDHPFVFIIYEKYSHGILSMGKICNI